MAYPETSAMNQQDRITEIRKELRDIKSEIQIIRNITRQLKKDCSKSNTELSSIKIDKSAQEHKLLTLDNLNNTLEDVLTYHDNHSDMCVKQGDGNIEAKTVVQDLSTESEHKIDPRIYREQSMNAKNLGELIASIY
ncbi:unnamed protein product [Colias eurytheme]|nr:unnamed protein product [Colias eurytheme]